MEIELDCQKIIKKFNEAVEKEKAGLRFSFPEPIGSSVEFRCVYNGNDLNKDRKNACVVDIVNTRNNHLYTDKYEDGQKINHIWLQNVYREDNEQVNLWKNLQINDRLLIRGVYNLYGESQKPTFQDPVILQVIRDGQIIYQYQ